MKPCSSRFRNQNRENSFEKSEGLSKELFHLLADLENLSDHRRSMSKESRSYTTVQRFFLGIWFLIQRKDGVNITYIWSFQRNCYRDNDALQKHERSGSLTWWPQRLLRNCHWNLGRRYISIIFVYTPPWLHSLNVNSSTKRKRFHTWKTQEADNIPELWQAQTT